MIQKKNNEKKNNELVQEWLKKIPEESLNHATILRQWLYEVPEEVLKEKIFIDALITRVPKEVLEAIPGFSILKCGCYNRSTVLSIVSKLTILPEQFLESRTNSFEIMSVGVDFLMMGLAPSAFSHDCSADDIDAFLSELKRE